ncbi:MAG: hypothetical protein VX737_01105 [Pseudomonadota bacterium]|nr:hypothetical protein [Pseudomonadota bacterium]
MHGSNISDTSNNKIAKLEGSTQYKIVLCHLVPKFLALQDLLVLRYAVGKEKVTGLANNEKKEANIILLSEYYRANDEINITKKPQKLSTKGQLRIKRAMFTLRRACINVADRMGYDEFIKTLNLFINVREISLGWYKEDGFIKVLTPLMISKFTNLTALDLKFAVINRGDVIYFKNLTKLMDLCLDACDFTENSEQGLSILTQLRTLKIHEPNYIEYTGHVSDEYLANLTQLKELSLEAENEDRDIKGIEHIGTLTGLNKLSLVNYQTLSDNNIINLSTLTNLSKLYLQDCSNFTINGIAVLTSLGKLEDLSINYLFFRKWEMGTNLESLAKFVSLKSLSIKGWDGIGNEALEDIAIMTGLTSLSLSFIANSANFNILESLISRLTRLEFLFMRVDDNSEEMTNNSIRKWPESLKTLVLDPVNDKILRGLYGHPNLTCLDLEDAGAIDDTDSHPSATDVTDFDQFISATPNLVSIIGLYGPEELAERRETLRTKSEGNVATLS